MESHEIQETVEIRNEAIKRWHIERMERERLRVEGVSESKMLLGTIQQLELMLIDNKTPWNRHLIFNEMMSQTEKLLNTNNTDESKKRK